MSTCLRWIRTVAIDVPPTEMLVGFINRREHITACAYDEAVSQIYRSSPLWDAARLRALVGKTILTATLTLRHKQTSHNPPCPSCSSCLHAVLFFSGRMGEASPPPSETRTLVVASSGTCRIDVTGMTRNWLLEEDSAYRGEHHNYRMEFKGENERMDFNNENCLSWFDTGSLEITYRD
jgi:hypothetical protein